MNTGEGFAFYQWALSKAPFTHYWTHINALLIERWGRGSL